MSIKLYLKYKMWKMRTDDIPQAKKDILKPNSVWWLYMIIFGYSGMNYIIRPDALWIWVSGVSFLVMLGISIRLDYINSPWRNWYVEQIKEKERKKEDIHGVE